MDEIPSPIDIRLIHAVQLIDNRHKARLAPQSFDHNRSNYVPPLWGVITQEVADAILALSLSWHTEEGEKYPTPQEVGCVGYEEL